MERRQGLEFCLAFALFHWAAVSTFAANSTSPSNSNDTSLILNFEKTMESLNIFTTKDSANYDKYDCSFLAYLQNSMKNHDAKDRFLQVNNSDFNCKFAFDRVSFLTEGNHPLVNALQVEAKGKWSCDLHTKYICNGKSECATDECSCDQSDLKSDPKNELTTFFCADNSGCISFTNLCDGRQNCRDSSDERFCPGALQLECPGITDNTYVPLDIYRDKRNSFDSLKCTILNEPEVPEISENLITKCLTEAVLAPEIHQSIVDALFVSLTHAKTHVSSLCRNFCSNCTNITTVDWHELCDHVSYNGAVFGTMVGFYCYKEDVDLGGTVIELDKVCDGSTDCTNGADERNCSGRFYCSNNSTASIEWIAESKVCDHVQDCSNGADECKDCNFGALSSSKFLIRSKVVLILAIVIGFLVGLLNIVEATKCGKSKPSSNAGKLDRILRIQIFIYDGLMGVYLIFIVIASIILRIRGDYCLLDKKWRASLICSTLGVIFTLSTHGSLFLVASMSVTRYLKCVRLNNHIGQRKVVIASAIIGTVNMVHSIIPLLPIAIVQHVFRTGIFFENLDANPFFVKNPINISRLAWMYETIFGRQENLYTMLLDLRNVTSKPQIFDTTEISYYGNTALCSPNLFKRKRSYKIYMLVYFTAIIVLLFIVTVTYAMVVRKNKRSKGRVVRGRQAHIEGRKDQSVSLTLKVFLMIGSQLVGWIPLIFTAVYYQYITSEPVPPMVFEVFYLVVMPVNSLLNPVFYSDLYKTVVQGLQQLKKKIPKHQDPVVPQDPVPVFSQNAIVLEEQDIFQEPTISGDQATKSTMLKEQSKSKEPVIFQGE